MFHATVATARALETAGLGAKGGSVGAAPYWSEVGANMLAPEDAKVHQHRDWEPDFQFDRTKHGLPS